MANAYHSLKTATHPCYDLLRGGYTCNCGYRSKNKKTHNLHVIANHTEREAEFLMSWYDFDKAFPPNKSLNPNA